MRLFLPFVLAGCIASPKAPCEHDGDGDMRLAPDGVALGAFDDGDPIPFGVPPQGGALYTPVYADASGLVDANDGVDVEEFVVDADDGTDLGWQSYADRLVCANVGPSADRWILGSVHHRYYDFDYEDLVDREIELTLVVTDSKGNEAHATLTGPLTWE